jgi:hypothetical protein
MQITAENHLHKTLHRIKSIANTGALPPHNSSSSVPDTATANVTARLYNAKLVKAALATTIQGIRQALGLDTTGSTPAVKKAKITEKEEEEEEWKGFSDDVAEIDAGVGGEEREEDEGSDSDGQDFAEFDARIASSSEGEGEEEEEDESDLDDSRDSSAAQLLRELAEANVEESSDTATIEPGYTNTSISSSERPPKAVDVAKRIIHAHLGIPRATSKSNSPTNPSQLPDLPINGLSVIDKDTGLSTDGTKPMDSDSGSSDQEPSPKLKPTSSAFLPSLTMGGYWSGSEGDEPEDIEEHVAPRKNRRGQRARQAIAEQKFGAAAKHVLEGRPANKPKDARDAGWDMKRGATNSEDVRGYKGMDRKERRSRLEGARKAGASGGNAIPIASGKIAAAPSGDARTFEQSVMVKPKRDDIGSLHPSWEAKRKAKAATGKIVPFQGKKITFD